MGEERRWRVDDRRWKVEGRRRRVVNSKIEKNNVNLSGPEG